MQLDDFGVTRFPDGSERRSAPLELRAGAGRTLEGYAAVFDKPTRIADLFEEVVRRGAFAASLANGKPVFLLSQHDFAQPLARSGAGGTLSLVEDGKGLAFSATLPETRAADDVLAQTRAGIVTGASFGFRVPTNGDRWPARDKRELVRVDLLEISAVTIPAYADATVSARAMARARGCAEANAYVRRLRLLEL